MRRNVLAVLVAWFLAAPLSASAAIVTLNFDGQAPANPAAGNLYASSGVLFSTVTENGVAAVGSPLTITAVSNSFWLLADTTSAVSDPNLAVAYGGGTRDVLMQFTTPVTSVELTTDAYPEGPDTVRLMALRLLPSGLFEILAFSSALDNATTSPGNLLSVSLGGTPFSYAIFVATTEQEGFDNLKFTPVPLPASAWLLLTGLVGFGALGRRRGSTVRPA